MNNEFKSLKQGEIIAIKYNDLGQQLNLSSNAFPNVLIRIEQLAEVFTKRLNVTDKQGNKLCEEGLKCEVLQFNSRGWQKGRLRATVILEFCPDEPPVEEKPITNEPESPLDDIRRMMIEESPQDM